MKKGLIHIYTGDGKGKTTAATGLAAGAAVTGWGALINLLLVGAKLLAGIFGHSQALIADAVHSLSDLLTDAVVLVGLRVGRKAPDAGHPFGHGRLETLALAVVGLALLGAAVVIGYDAARAIYAHSEQRPTWLAAAGAAVSVLAKEGIYRYTVHVGRKIGSPLVVANAWHHRSDALSSVAVLVGVAAAQIHDAWHILDAYAAGLVSFFIVKVGLEVLWDAARELSDAAPKLAVVESIAACAGGVEGVEGVHDVKVRSSAGRYHVLIHVDVPGELTVVEGHAVGSTVSRRVRERIPEVDDVLVHVDPAGLEDDET